MNDRSRPAKAASETSATTSTTSVTLTADELVYAAQFWTEIGYKAAWHAMRIGGEDAARAAASFLRLHPRYAELEVRRRPAPERPCTARCGRCSRCICSETYTRRGGPFTGVDNQVFGTMDNQVFGTSSSSADEDVMPSQKTSIAMSKSESS